jgi:hypothetical protein
VPTITQASVSDSAGGDGNHSLSVVGTDFLQGATVQWDGVALATTYISSSELSAVVPSSDYGALPAVVTVMNAPPLSELSAGFPVQ